MTIQNSNDQKINKLSDIQLTILNNDKIEDKLNVIIVHFNPMKFKRIKELALKFKNEMVLMDDEMYLLLNCHMTIKLKLQRKIMIDIYNYQQQLTIFSGQKNH